MVRTMMNMTCQKQGLGIASGRVAGAGQWRSVHQSSYICPNIRNNLAFAFFSHLSIILYKKFSYWPTDKPIPIYPSNPIHIHWGWHLFFSFPNACCFNRIYVVCIKYKRKDMCIKELKWDCACIGFIRFKAISRVHVTILAFQFPPRTKVYICMRHIKHWILYPVRQNFPAAEWFTTNILEEQIVRESFILQTIRIDIVFTYSQQKLRQIKNCHSFF